jgi:GH43 family beta-xylosidase
MTETEKGPLVTWAADPWVTKWNNTYLYCRSIEFDHAIAVVQAPTLDLIGKEEPVIVWETPDTGPCSEEVWAPELHFLDDKWYIYFAASNGDNATHRMFVLESAGTDPLGPYECKGEVATPSGNWAIDGTVLEYQSKRYFIWSGWEEYSQQQNLYIAQMEDPLTLGDYQVCISQPTYEWECHGEPPVNEGPQILMSSNRIYLIYSASGSWTDDYCLGQLALQPGADPMDPASWVKKVEPVFRRTDKVFGPGHASFVKTQDDRDWIVYHAAQHSGAGWKRNVHAQEFYWEDDEPVFGEPLAA